MEIVGLADARSQLGKFVDQARHKQIPTAITRNGHIAAVLVSADWYQSHKGDEDTDVNMRGTLPPNDGSE